MKKTFGEHATYKPEGMLRAIHWPSMGTMDKWTGDGRRLYSGGGGVRNLPRTFTFAFEASGHECALPVGHVDEVALHEDGNIEGWGWLVDTEEARKAAVLIATKTQHHNSMELAEVKADVDIDWDTMEIKIDFIEWNIAATTGVHRPAFADSTIELTDEMTASMIGEAYGLTDEMIASIYSDEAPLEMPFESFDIHVEIADVEMVASLATTVPWDDFHIPESDTPHKIILDEEGRVYGHLAQWSSPHRGFKDRVRYCPRPTDGYTGFNHSGPLTEKGPVGTGPIFAVGGHAKKSIRGLTREQIADAYGGIENAWADVRVTEGRYGPWISGRVRPGVSDEVVYAVRASHISGHWVDGELLAIVSCSVPGFQPGAGFAAIEEGKVVELVASFVDSSPPSDRIAEAVTVDVPVTFHFDQVILDQIAFQPSVESVPRGLPTDSLANLRRRTKLRLELDDDA